MEIQDGLGLGRADPRRQGGGLVSYTTGKHEMDVKSCSKLQAKGIITSIRYQKGVGGIRVSTHFFNTEDEIDRVLSVQGTLLK